MDQGIKPASLTAFGTAVKAAGIGRDSRNNRSAYLDIALAGTPLRVVANKRSA